MTQPNHENYFYWECSECKFVNSTWIQNFSKVETCYKCGKWFKDTEDCVVDNLPKKKYKVSYIRHELVVFIVEATSEQHAKNMSEECDGLEFDSFDILSEEGDQTTVEEVEE